MDLLALHEAGSRTDVDQPPPPYSPPQLPLNGYATSGYPVNDGVTVWSSDPPLYTEEYKHPDDGNAAHLSQVADYRVGPHMAPNQPEQQLQQQHTVVLRQPEVSSWGAPPPGSLVEPPEDYMCYSIFVTLCCCWLIGIFAIARSAECRAAIAVGDRVTAEAKSREARSKAHLALGLGIVSCALVAIIIGVYFGVWVARLY